MVDSETLLGRTLGDFRIVERLGAGGFGVAYRALQISLDRECVVKVQHRRRGRCDIAGLQRFMREAQIAARFDHPYAAHVYAFGVEPEDGLCWIAMEYVRGDTLEDWLRTHERSHLETIAPLVERIAEVVHAGHEIGIVHRDLKPSNIMVIVRAGKLIPRLLDFGLAKLASLPGDEDVAYVDEDRSTAEIAFVDEAPEGTGPTERPPLRAGPLRAGPFRTAVPTALADGASGTPGYMSPEQWTASSSVGSSTDIYALAIIVYRALSGRLPYEAATLEQWAALHRFAPVPSLGDEFAPALDRLFQRALAKRPSDRWGTATEFAGALRAELEARLRSQLRVAARQWEDRGQPTDLLWRGEVLADLERSLRHPGAPPLTGLETEFAESSRTLAMASQRRAVRIKRGLAAIGVAVALVALEYRSVLQTRAAEQLAELRTRSAEQLVTQAEAEQGRSSLLLGQTAEAQRHLTQAYQRGDRSPGVAFMLARSLQPRVAELARLASIEGRMWSAAFSPDGTQIVTTDDKGAQVWDARTNQRLFAFPHTDTVYQAVYTADGTRLATVGGDGVVRIWQADTGARELELKTEGAKPLRYFMAAWSPNGRLVAAIDKMGEVVHVWDAETGTLLARLPNDTSGFPSLAFSVDGRWLATSGGDEVRVFETTAWAPTVVLAARHVRSLSFDPTGPRLATGATDGDASIWEIPSGARVRHLREIGEAVDAVAFAPNGELVVTAARDGTEQVWNAATGTLRSQGNHLRDKILSIEFDPTSKLVVTAGANGTVVVSDVDLGMPVSVLEGPQSVVRVAHFDPSSRRVVAASLEGAARVWDATSPYRRWTLPPISGDCGLVTSLEPDRRFIATGCRALPTRIVDTASDRVIAELPSVTPVEGDFDSAFPAVSALGDRAAIARGTTVEIYELPSGRLLRTINHGAAVNAVAFAVVGHDVVSGAVDGSLLVTRDGRDPMAMPGGSTGIDAATILADGRVVAADAGRRLRIYDVNRVDVLADLAVPARIGLVRVSATGRMISIPRYADKAPPVLWDLERYRLIGQLEGHVGPVRSARFVAGGRILTAGVDGTARMWDDSARQLHLYTGSSRFLADATLDPGGLIVVAAGGDGMLRFWGASDERQLWRLPAHKSHAVGVHFEGDDIITRGFGGDVSRWVLPKPAQVVEACSARQLCAIVPK